MSYLNRKEYTCGQIFTDVYIWEYSFSYINYNHYFKRNAAGACYYHSPLSSAAVMEEWSYTSTHPLSNTEFVTGSLYMFTYFKQARLIGRFCVLICTSGRERITLG